MKTNLFEWVPLGTNGLENHLLFLGIIIGAQNVCWVESGKKREKKKMV